MAFSFGGECHRLYRCVMWAAGSPHRPNPPFTGPRLQAAAPPLAARRCSAPRQVINRSRGQWRMELAREARQCSATATAAGSDSRGAHALPLCTHPAGGSLFGASSTPAFGAASGGFGFGGASTPAFGAAPAGELHWGRWPVRATLLWSEQHSAPAARAWWAMELDTASNPTCLYAVQLPLLHSQLGPEGRSHTPARQSTACPTAQAPRPPLGLPARRPLPARPHLAWAVRPPPPPGSALPVRAPRPLHRRPHLAALVGRQREAPRPLPRLRPPLASGRPPARRHRRLARPQPPPQQPRGSAWAARPPPAAQQRRPLHLQALAPARRRPQQVGWGWVGALRQQHVPALSAVCCSWGGAGIRFLNFKGAASPSTHAHRYLHAPWRRRRPRRHRLQPRGCSSPRQRRSGASSASLHRAFFLVRLPAGCDPGLLCGPCCKLRRAPGWLQLPGRLHACNRCAPCPPAGCRLLAGPPRRPPQTGCGVFRRARLSCYVGKQGTVW